MKKILEKFKISKYSKNIKRYGVATIITKFALANIIILFSMNLLKNNIEFSLLKEIKNYAIVFAIVSYFIVKKANMKGTEIKTTIFMEIMIIITIILSLFNPYFLILLMGFYTIDGLVELTGRFKIFENDTYPENNVEKNSIMNIGTFTAQGLSSLILINMSFNISITIVIISMIIAIIIKYQCQKELSEQIDK